MIEMIYKGNAQENEAEETHMIPKNIRQIGDGGKEKKVYLEDYAVTYMHQTERAVLVGETWKKEACQYVFIHGAVQVPKENMEDEDWEKVYRTVKEHFPGSRIMGWALQKKDEPLEMTEQLWDSYKGHYSEENEVMILHNAEEKEDVLYLYENETLVRQKGYYIYYEKNKAMQEFMVNQNEGRSIEKEAKISDKAIENFRKIAEEKKEKEPAKQPRTSRFLYAASTFLVVTVLALGVTMINNYDKMKEMELTLAGMTQGSTEEPEAVKTFHNQTKETETETAAKSSAGLGEETGNKKNVLEAKEHEKTEETEGATESNQAALETEMKIQETQQNEAGKENALGEEAEGQTNATSVGEAEDQGNALSNGEAEGQENALSNGDDESQGNALSNGDDEGQGNALSNGEAEGQTESAAPTMADPERSSQASYTVKIGDTLADICKMYYGTTDQMEAICELNGISDANRILPGQKLLLP